MFLTLVQKVEAAVTVHRYQEEAMFIEDFHYLNDEYLGAVSALDPSLGDHLKRNVFSEES
jgi:hypothetical protein